MPSWLSLPESDYLLSVAVQLNHQTPHPITHLRRILKGRCKHSETIIATSTYHSPFSPLIPDLRQQFIGNKVFEDAFTLISIEGFSAGSLIGMSIFRLLAECGTTIRALPNKTTLGAIAMSPLLFYNFFELGRNPSPSTSPMARQSAWNPERKLRKGVSFVRSITDLACPINPTVIRKQLTQVGSPLLKRNGLRKTRTRLWARIPRTSKAR
jgi:hypothetical protein